MNIKTKFELGSRLRSSDARKEIWIKRIVIEIRASFGYAPGEGRPAIYTTYIADYFDNDNPKYRDVFGNTERVYDELKFSEEGLLKEFPFLDVSKN